MAVGGFPPEVAADPIVQRNAAIIKQIYDAYERQPYMELATTVAVLGAAGQRK